MKTKKPAAPPAPETPSVPEPVTEHLSITITGTPEAVREALHAIRFEGEWSPAVARKIARLETLVDDARMGDKLGGEKIRFFSQDARDSYVQRCVNKTGEIGHPVPDPGDIPAEAETTVMEVGDALFDHARP